MPFQFFRAFRWIEAFSSRLHSSLIIIVWLVFASSAANSEEPAKAEAAAKADPLNPQEIWSSLLAERQKLISGRCDVQVDVLLVSGGEEANQLEGSTRIYHLYWGKDQFRVDLTETRPNNPADAQDYRTSYFEGKYRCIPVNRPNVVAYEYDAKNPDLKPQLDFGILRACTSIDPRMCGVWPEHFTSLGRLSFSKLLEPPTFLTGMEAKIESQDGEELISLRWMYPKNNAVREFVLDPKLNYAPRRVSMTLSPPNVKPTRYSIDCEWQKISISYETRMIDYAFPETITYQCHEGDQLDAHEISRFSPPESLNAPHDPAIFDWPALGLRTGAVVDQINASNETNTVQWNGKVFGEWKAIPMETLFPPSTAPPPNRWRGVLFWGNIVVMLACVGGYLLLKRARSRTVSEQ